MIRLPRHWNQNPEKREKVAHLRRCPTYRSCRSASPSAARRPRGLRSPLALPRRAAARPHTHLPRAAAGCTDAELDRALTLLRVLHINDMRDLQTEVDRLLVQVQEYTADPRTDASLGKVGR